MVTTQDSFDRLETARELRRQASEFRKSGLYGRMRAADACLGNPYQARSATAHLFDGSTLQVDVTETVGRNLFLFGAFEEDLTAFVLSYLKPGMIFADIGAHVGYFSKIAANCVGSSGHVHAFEPTPATFMRLSTNLGPLGNATCHRIALWSTARELVLNDYGAANSAYNSWTRPRSNDDMPVQATHTVAARPVDAVFPDSGAAPALIKIDVESAELEVLRGMERTLTEARPIVTIEVGDIEAQNPNVPTSRAILRHVVDRGYRLFTSRQGRLEPHDLMGCGAYGYDNVICVPEGHPMASDGAARAVC
ncbi:FkbM family methyltransferase [Palleronia rufa]|uniref:FkbM family methyltransferase n=1 Tax=Palleronia rufa TaxID=1530186 RepID=UPI00068F8F33|nr:FkbM family methyltransferase [Palleronia rufa]